MIRRPPRSTRTYTLFPYTTLFRSPTLYTAHVEKLGQDCDLAILSVSNPKFWKKAKPLPVSEIDAEIEAPISVYGFPVGGKNISITSGHISRTEKKHIYAHSGVHLPVAQVTAPINPGNSGGPAISKGTVVGVAFQGMPGHDGGGYIIPATTLLHFLRDIRRNTNRGFPGLSITTKTITESERLECGLSEEQTGIKVNTIAPLSAAFGVLQPEDILLEIEDKQIFNDGTIAMDDDELEDYQVLVNQKFIGDKISFTVLRGDKILEEELVLKNAIGAAKLVQPRAESEQETFYWHSCLLFQVLTRNFLEQSEGLAGLLSGMEIPARLSKIKDELKKHEHDEAVFFNCPLPCEQTVNTNPYQMSLVKKINGKEIQCMLDAVYALEHNSNPFHKIEFDDNKFLEVKNLPKHNQDQELRKFGILCDRSENLMAVSKLENKRPKTRKRKEERSQQEEHTPESIDVDKDKLSETFKGCLRLPPSELVLREPLVFSDVYGKNGILSVLGQQLAYTGRKCAFSDEIENITEESQKAGEKGAPNKRRRTQLG